MTRKNIFKAKTLTLDYENPNFILLKDDNQVGRRYSSAREAKALIITIKQEMQKPNHSPNYCLEEFYITPKAESRLEKITQKH